MIRKACEACGIAPYDVTAIGDDGHAIDAVKEAADVVIGSNDADGIAEYLEALDE